MKLHRFFGDFDLTSPTIIISDTTFINQIKNVLRLKEGSSIILCDNKNNETIAHVVKITSQSIECETTKVIKNSNEPTRHITLYCSLLKRENFELALQKATEIGIKEIVPLLCDRTVKLNLKKERLEKIAREAAEQSGRGIIPQIHEVQNFSDAIKSAESNAINIIFEPLSPSYKAVDIDDSSRVGIFIGPEGGWSENELSLIYSLTKSQKKYIIASLGKLTLRAETASIVASFLLIHN